MLTRDSGVDIFPLMDPDGRAYLRRAAFQGAHELGLFQALSGRPGGMSAVELASSLGTAPRRLRALLDVLVLEQALGRMDNLYFLQMTPPFETPLPRRGWGLVADTIRQDRPLAALPQPEEVFQRYHNHLRASGSGNAAEVAAQSSVQEGEILDAGGGTGAYTAACLDAAPNARATVVDFPEVIDLARQALVPYGTRVHFIQGDIREVALGEGYQAALMANLLHLYGPESCALLVSRVAAALRPGGRLVVLDLRIDPERRAPASSVLFTLNMALYTEEGDVHDAERIGGWLLHAGLIETQQHALKSAPNILLLTARRPG